MHNYKKIRSGEKGKEGQYKQVWEYYELISFWFFRVESQQGCQLDKSLDRNKLDRHKIRIMEITIRRAENMKRSGHTVTSVGYDWNVRHDSSIIFLTLSQLCVCMFMCIYMKKYVLFLKFSEIHFMIIK